MAKKEFMNINLQMILAVIPYIQLYSAYRIEKFRLFFLVWLVIQVGTAILFYFIGVKISYLSILIGIPLYVFLIRKWSIEWNEFLSNISKNEFDNDVSGGVPLR